MTGVLIGILCFIIVLYFDIQSDYKRLNSNTIQHKRGAFVRALVLLPSFGCFYFPLENLQWWYILLKIVVVGCMMAAWWWEFFDGLLNLKRKESWRFNGSDDPNDAKTDNLLQGLSGPQQALLKWGLITVFTTIYILLKTNVL